MRLEAKNLSFSYGSGSRMILNRLSLTVESGELVGLSAPSGFGKTTCCRILAGYEKPEGGQVLLDGRPLETYRGRMPVQMIWQHPEHSVNPRWKMKKILNEGGTLGPDLIKRLGIREEWLERYPAELSGGELQRFCIARALGKGTEILLADEITTMLDMVTQSIIWHVLLEEAKERKLGMLVVSHSESLLKRVCTRVIAMEQL